MTAMTTATHNMAIPTHAEILATFLANDTTHNGAIDPNEWRTASRALFEITDKNHDGVIERAEVGDNALIREAFPDFAQGHDGKLTKQEFLDLRETIFHAADIDGNGYITFVEYEILVLLRRTGWVDRDKDGRIEMSELRTVLEQAFKLLDAKHDGALTGNDTELFAPESLAAMDPQHTARITLEQLINGYRFLLGADQVNRNFMPRG
jgi:Ca2+-binding EF-hand superfamily protein